MSTTQQERAETPGANKWQFSPKLKIAKDFEEFWATYYNDITNTQNCSQLKDETPAGKNNGATTILQYGKKNCCHFEPNVS